MKRVIQLFSKNKESEDTWQKFEQALRNITVWTVQDKAHRYETFAAHLRALKRPIIQSVRRLFAIYEMFFFKKN